VMERARAVSQQSGLSLVSATLSTIPAPLLLPLLSEQTP
jgi:hypothetical protein